METTQKLLSPARYLPVHSFDFKAFNFLEKSQSLKMASLRIQPFSSKISSHLSSLPSTILLPHNHKLRSTRVSCTNRISDASLASELTSRIAKIKTDRILTEEAIRKSREILFGEFCEYLGLKEDEAKQKWRKIDEDERWALIKRFVTEWGVNFHPLSARSAKEMVEEYLRRENYSSVESVFTFPGLRRIMGFSENK